MAKIHDRGYGGFAALSSASSDGNDQNLYFIKYSDEKNAQTNERVLDDTTMGLTRSLGVVAQVAAESKL